MKSCFISVKLMVVLVCLISFVSSLGYGEESQEPKKVFLAILARNKAHVLPRFLNCINNLDYPKKSMTVYINTNNNEDETENILRDWVKEYGNHYQSILFDQHEIANLSDTKPHEWTKQRLKLLATIRNQSMHKAKEQQCDYYFVVDCDNFISPCTLKVLVSKEKPIIAPMLLSIPETQDLYSNYFYDVTENGYFKDHPNFKKILFHQMRGTFKVPVVHCAYLIQSAYIDRLNYIDDTDDYEFIVFSRGARNNGVDQFICNEEDFGVQLHYFDSLSLQEEGERYQKIPESLFP